LYIQCYTEGYAQWANPTHVYLLSLLYLIVPPGNLSARLLGAATMFLAALLLGLLARRLSGKTNVGVIVALTGIFTPWLFEISRLVFESSSYPLIVVLFLFAVHNGFRRGRWTNLDCLLIALTLSLITYSYTIGRLLGPVLGLGLLLFAVNWRQFWNVVKVGIIYSLTLIPFGVVYFGNSAAITGRFMRAAAIDTNKPFLDNAGTVLSNYLSDIGPEFLLQKGDALVRHHLPGMGEILVGTLALSLLGILLVLIRHRSSAWWRFVLFGLVVSVIPGALTSERSHALRLIVLPVFLILLLVPALSWLLDDESEGRDRLARRALLYSVLAITALQAIWFQVHYRSFEGHRALDFNEAYPRVLEKALAEETRPIYLDEGGEPAYIHAYWYGAQLGYDRSHFVHLLDNQFPPVGALVITSEGSCTDCDVLSHDGSFILYRNRSRRSGLPIAPSQRTAVVPEKGSQMFMRPLGIAIDTNDNRFVADTDNSRIRRLDPQGKLISDLGIAGTGEGQIKQPHGIAISMGGDLFVTDPFRHKVLKLRSSDGAFVREWAGPTELGFFGPRDLAFDANGRLFIVDQGRARIVRFDVSNDNYFSWGTQGAGDGQFDQPTGISVAGDQVFVADTGNGRIQVFDLDGKFIRQWAVPEWNKNVPTFPDVAYDAATGRVYVSSGQTTEIRVYDEKGTYLESVVPQEPAVINNPSSLLITSGAYGKRLVILNTGSDLPVTGDASIATIEIGKAAAKK
ncbi:MAG: NHL repeat-containing protein, partial [Pyrinomonadaceae bacterium]